MIVLKKIIVFILVVNVFILPINLYFSYDYARVLSLKNEYFLKKVNIEKIIDLSYQDENSSYEAYEISYYIYKDESIIMDSIVIGKGSREGSNEYNHFIISGKKNEVFGGHLMPKKNDSIWVWHNSKAKDFYALGDKDTFKVGKYWVKLIFHLLLFLIAIWSIRYQIRYNKKHKTRINET